MSESPTITEADILTDVISPGEANLNPEAARSILELRFNDHAMQRMRVLLERSNQGALSESEEEELAKWRRVGLFLDLMQAKARASLPQSRT